MKFAPRNSLVIILLAGLLLCQRGSAGAQMQTDDHGHMDMDESGGAAGEPADVQMARAIAAGPRHVTDAARIVGADAQGKTMVLREGSNGFTCQPGNPKVPGRLASCWNEAARQWRADLAAHKAKADERRARHHLHAGGRRAAQRVRSVRPDHRARRARPTMDDHVAVRSEDDRTVGRAQGHRRVHHVGRHALRAPAHHGPAGRARQWNTWPMRHAG